MSEKLETLLLTKAIARLAFMSGLALGLAPKDREDEIYKIAEDNRGFWEAVEITLKEKESHERKEK